VVHDAARPFATPELVRATLAALDDADGAIAAIPMDETLKRLTDDKIMETLDRTELWRAQTPQAFKTDVLRIAHERAVVDGLSATDDAALVEHYGGRVKIVQGSPDNLKLTFPSHFALAEAILGGRS
jgi:2-C-methyl-D-erythritol 4-phosphate cytidylyltransferase